METFKSQDGDRSTMRREAEQYADDLARELIDDTDNLVRTVGHSQTPEAVPDSQNPGEGDSEQVDNKVDATLGLLSVVEAEPSSLQQADATVNEPMQPSAIVAQTALYFDQDSLDESLEPQARKQVNGEEEGTREAQPGQLDPEPVEQAELEVDDRKDQNEEEQFTVEKEKETPEELQQEGQFEELPVKVDRQQSEEVKEEQFEEEAEKDQSDEESRLLGNESGLFKGHDQTNLFHQTFKTAANSSQLSNHDQTEAMEFTKNYSDDLLMGQRSVGGADSATGVTGGPDLADFELPTYSGSSSSASEHTSAVKQQSPSKQKKSSSAGLQASSSQTSIAAPDLTAVKDIIVSSYSRVSHVFHWKRPIETGALFASGMTIIIALTFFSIISVVAYSALGVILASALIRIFKSSMKALNRPSDTPFDHIWLKVLDLNVSFSPEKMHELVDVSHGNLNASLVYFKQVLLVEDKFATFKFGFLLYLLTYIGSWFNGLTLITICYLSLFSIPLLYEKNKTKIDEYLNMASKQIYSTITTATNKVTSMARSATKANEKQKQN